MSKSIHLSTRLFSTASSPPLSDVLFPGIVEAHSVVDEDVSEEKRLATMQILKEKAGNLETIKSRYGRLARHMEFQEDKKGLVLMDKHIQLGAHYFVHKRQKEDGLLKVHRLDYGDSIRAYMKGIKEDDYEFYDDYLDCKEVLIVGSSNSGKSSLINVLNDNTKVAKVRKKSGKTQSLMFYLSKIS